MDIERRYVSGLEFRLRNGKQRLEGLAIPYESISEDIGFRETIAKGAFSKHLRSDPDVKALVEHRTDQIVGRTRSGTLRLEESSDGVHVSIDPPDSPRGNDLVESVRRGDLSSMSFGFRVLDDSWETRNGESHRIVKEAELFETSVVSNPSYPETSIALRSRDRWQKEDTIVNDPIVEPTTAVTADVEPETRTVPAEPVANHGGVEVKIVDPSEWRDWKTDTVHRVLDQGQSSAEAFPSKEPLSFGRALIGCGLGDFSRAPAEERCIRALSTVDNPSAGYLTPDPLAANVIDILRGKSVIFRAGAKIINIPSSSLRIARLTGDATVAVTAENSAIASSDITLDSIELTPLTIAALVVMSRDLAKDAPNAVSLVENALAQKMAERIDYFALQGTGSAQPLGLVNISGTNTVAVGGTVDYDNIIDGIAECEIDNAEPNAVLASPANVKVLRKLKVNAEANHYAIPPASVSSLSTLSTTLMPDATIAVGDFSQFLVGVREGVSVKADEGGKYHEANQIAVRVLWRGTFNIEHPTSFCLLTGIA